MFQLKKPKGQCQLNSPPKTPPIAPKTAPKTAPIIPNTTPKSPAISPKIPPAIPIQIGKVKTITKTIRRVDVELFDCIYFAFQKMEPKIMRV